MEASGFGHDTLVATAKMEKCVLPGKASMEFRMDKEIQKYYKQCIL